MRNMERIICSLPFDYVRKTRPRLKNNDVSRCTGLLGRCQVGISKIVVTTSIISSSRALSSRVDTDTFRGTMVLSSSSSTVDLWKGEKFNR